MAKRNEKTDEKKSLDRGVVVLLVLSVLIGLLVESGDDSRPVYVYYLNAMLIGLFCYFLGACILLALAAKLLPSELTRYAPWVFVGVGVLYSLALLDARREPWSLWEIRETARSTERLKKIARYSVYGACKNQERRKLDEEMEAYRVVPQTVSVYIREGNTIFKLGQPLGTKLTEKLKASHIAKLEKRGDLTEYQKNRMVDDLYGPEIESTLSFVCLPTTRDNFWPFYTPKRSFVAAETLADVGRAELKGRAREILVGGR